MKAKDLLKSWMDWKGRNYTQKQLSIESGITETTISQNLNRDDARPSTDTIEKISRALGITVSQFWAGPPPREREPTDFRDGEIVPGLGEVRRFDPEDTIPVLGKIPAGHWQEWVDHYPPGIADEYVPRYDVRGKHIFAVRVSGDSMEPDLRNGDLLVVNPELAFTPKKGGRIGVVRCDGDYQVRKVFLTPDGNSYLLEPSNRAYESEIVPVTGTVVFKVVAWWPKREEMF